MASVQLPAEDVLKALKRFKRLAKQDILASERTPDPAFWREQAEVRRRVYDRLMEQVAAEGVAAAYEKARVAYAELPLLRDEGSLSPAVSGERQALELFFHIIGAPVPSQDGGSGTPVEEPGQADAEGPLPSTPALTSNA